MFGADAVSNSTWQGAVHRRFCEDEGEAAEIADQVIDAGATSGTFAFSDAVDLGANSNQFEAERPATAGSYAQFSQIQLEVVSIPIPAPVIP